MADALKSSVVTLVREAVPEFEPHFQDVLRDEGGEMGSFQAVSTFAEWLLMRLQAAPSAPEVQRSFEVIERLASDASTVPLGAALLTELLEVIQSQSSAVERLGPVSSGVLSAW